MGAQCLEHWPGDQIHIRYVAMSHAATTAITSCADRYKHHHDKVLSAIACCLPAR